jgi:hypothetical protein
MRASRRRIVVAVAVFALVAAGCEEGEKAVAYVDGTKITREQLDEAVEHFEEEAQREGKNFPAEGTHARAQAERRLLDLLVYRAEVEHHAGTLGIHVTEGQVEERLEAGGESGEDESDDAFVKSSIRTQLILEAVAKRLARRIHETDLEAATAKRNAALADWVADAKRAADVRIVGER